MSFFRDHKVLVIDDNILSLSSWKDRINHIHSFLLQLKYVLDHKMLISKPEVAETQVFVKKIRSNVSNFLKC